MDRREILSRAELARVAAVRRGAVRGAVRATADDVWLWSVLAAQRLLVRRELGAVRDAELVVDVGQRTGSGCGAMCRGVMRPSVGGVIALAAEARSRSISGRSRTDR